MSIEDHQKRRHARELATCVHFNGTINRACKVGVVYDTLRGTSALPCLPPIGNKICTVTCEHRRFPTEEEVAAEEAETKKRIDETLTARKAIVEAIGPWKKGRPGESGMMPCPICKKGTLKYSRSGYNGHVWDACSTDGCVRWMD